jgi:hypothetical protein
MTYLTDALHQCGIIQDGNYHLTDAEARLVEAVIRAQWEDRRTKAIDRIGAALENAVNVYARKW